MLIGTHMQEVWNEERLTCGTSNEGVVRYIDKDTLQHRVFK